MPGAILSLAGIDAILDVPVVPIRVVVPIPIAVGVPVAAVATLAYVVHATPAGRSAGDAGLAALGLIAGATVLTSAPGEELKEEEQPQRGSCPTMTSSEMPGGNEIGMEPRDLAHRSLEDYRPGSAKAR